EQVPTGPAQLLGLANGTGPVQAVVLDVTGDPSPDSSLGLAHRFQEQYPHVAVLLVTDSPMDLGLAALRAGVRDLVEPSVSIDEMRWTLRRAMEASASAGLAADQLETEPLGRVITVASPKG